MRNRSQVVLPLNLEICIPKDDPVFKMVEICEQLDYTELYRAYLRSWRKINPETLFELLVFGYMNRKYSARQIEEACRTDIRFMWILQGEPVPDHSTIARFQNEKLTGVIEDLFYQLVEKLHEAGEVGAVSSSPGTPVTMATLLRPRCRQYSAARQVPPAKSVSTRRYWGWS